VGAVFVLLHSPALGPRSWHNVARELVQAGRDVAVPSLTAAFCGAPPTWPAVVESVAATVPAGTTEVVVVAHSGAGLYVPAVVDRFSAPVTACVLVDAALPPPRGSVPAAPAELLGQLRPMALDGRLPVWTDWWDPADVDRLFPDPVTRREVAAEQPRLPLVHYEQELPVREGWDDRPCGYLAFGDTYGAEAAEAIRRGWRVVTLPGRHLHQLVDPAAVAAELLGLVAPAGGAPRRLGGPAPG
jgi:hypothetical protein